MPQLIYQYYVNKPKSESHISVDFPYWELSKKSISKYAENCHADYRFLEDEHLTNPFYGIFLPFLQGWCHAYDKVCFIDSDVLAVSTAKNIFEISSDDCVTVSQLAHQRGHPYFKNKGGYVNTGITVIPRAIYNDFTKYATDMIDKKIPMKYGGHDQYIVNEYIASRDKFCSLDTEFNWHMTRYDQTKRFDQSLIHYHRKTKPIMKTDFEDDRILK